MNTIRPLIFAALLASCGVPPTTADAGDAIPSESVASRPEIEMLLLSQLERVVDTEVIVSRVQLPPNTALPKHWHPGEEFVYVLKGRVTLWQKGKDDLVFSEGGVGKVPFKQVHTAATGDEGADLLVFRVHEKGQPERVVADEN